MLTPLQLPKKTKQPISNKIVQTMQQITSKSNLKKKVFGRCMRVFLNLYYLLNFQLSLTKIFLRNENIVV